MFPTCTHKHYSETSTTCPIHLHLWTFKFAQKYENKNIQKCKINSCAYRFPTALTTIVLLFLVSSLKQVKDDALLNSSGLVCLFIQQVVKFIIFTAEFASRVLNTVCLFWQLTQLEHTKRRYTSLFFLSL